MHQVTASLIRVLVVIAMGFGFATVIPAGRIGAQVTARRCECCKNMAEPSCCAAPENRTSSPQPAAPSPRTPAQGQPAALPLRTVIVLLPPVTEIVFPPAHVERSAGAGGHSFQSLRCVRVV